VNLSARQLEDPSLVDEITATLHGSGLPPSALVLEITESVLLQDTPDRIARLQALADLGVRLAVDDFGTGYSALSYLRTLPVHILKLDKSFIDSLDNRRDLALTGSIVALAQNLELGTVAEGVEDPAQAEALRRMGCDSGQGFLFARPMYAEELMTLSDTPLVLTARN
jgi:EAL domain-containing protein (putative c-di-GMP-specific phosphodiesterase class I)